MNKKFITVSISIFLLSFIFILGFKLILGDKLLYANSTEYEERAAVKYSGFEEDENTYKIKINIKNNSKYYAGVNNINLQFSYNTKDNSGYSTNDASPLFRGYDKTEREYLLNYMSRDEYSFSSFLNPNEEREYTFEISKGLKLDEKAFDTNRMSISYEVDYFKYRISSNSVMGDAGSIWTTESVDNSTMPFTIE